MLRCMASGTPPLPATVAAAVAALAAPRRGPAAAPRRRRAAPAAQRRHASGHGRSKGLGEVYHRVFMPAHRKKVGRQWGKGVRPDEMGIGVDGLRRGTPWEQEHPQRADYSLTGESPEDKRLRELEEQEIETYGVPKAEVMTWTEIYCSPTFSFYFFGYFMVMIPLYGWLWMFNRRGQRYQAQGEARQAMDELKMLNGESARLIEEDPDRIADEIRRAITGNMDPLRDGVSVAGGVGRVLDDWSEVNDFVTPASGQEMGERFQRRFWRAPA